MSGAHRPALAVVRDNDPSAAEGILASVVPALISTEEAAQNLRRVMAEIGRELAKERGLKFIRPEQLRAEFGGGNGAQA